LLPSPPYLTVQNIREYNFAGGSVWEQGLGPVRNERETEENCVTLTYVLLAKINYNYQVEEGDIRRACSTNGEKSNAYMILVGKLEIKIPLSQDYVGG
jgi:hypothetical protein